jgi:hypothetical protein
MILTANSRYSLKYRNRPLDYKFRIPALLQSHLIETDYASRETVVYTVLPYVAEKLAALLFRIQGITGQNIARKQIYC